MEGTSLREPFLAFLVEAKRHTYAAEGGAPVGPLLPGSHQLEYRSGRFLYRDVYFGSAYFVGQETVYIDGEARWAMSYAGGVDRAMVAGGDTREVYAFLRAALREVSSRNVFRGPPEYRLGAYLYTASAEGDIEKFHGSEAITRGDEVVYGLRFSGGEII